MSDTLRRMGRNLRWLTASEAAGRVLGFVYTAVLARMLGLEGFGSLTLALVYSEAFQLVVGLSLQDVIIREGARNGNRIAPCLRGGLVIQAGLAVVAMVAGILLGRLHGAPLDVLLPLAALLGSIRSFARTLLGVPAAGEDLRPSALYALLERVAGFLALLAFLFLDRTLTMFFAGLTLGAVFTTLYALDAARRAGGFVRGSGRVETSGAGDPIGAAYLVREGLAFSGLRWIALARSRADALLVEFLLGREALGLYGAALRLFDVAKVLPNLVERALFPVVSRTHG